MSFDLDVKVSAPLSREAIEGALAELGAPCRLTCEPAEFAGYVPIEVLLHGVRLYMTGFEAYAPKPEDPERSYGMTVHEGDDLGAAWTMATAMAIAGQGVVVDLQSGARYPPAKREKLIAKVERWKKKVERAYEKLSDAERAFRVRHAGETIERWEERLFMRGASRKELVAYVKEKIAAALSRGDDAEAARLVDLTPADPAFLEPIIDPCFRAGRVDLARTWGARFGPAALRTHLLESVRWVGSAAVPYARFLVDVACAREDDQLLADAREAAVDDAMRAALRP